jgi:hypothetical protein
MRYPTEIEATEAGTAALNRMKGSGWELEVRVDISFNALRPWYFTISCPFAVVSENPYINMPGNFRCVIGGLRQGEPLFQPDPGTPDFDNPNEAVSYAIANAEKALARYLKKCARNLDGLRSIMAEDCPTFWDRLLG